MLMAGDKRALQLLIRAAAVGAQVQVQSILDRFAFRHGKHVDRRPDSIGRGDADAVLVNLAHLPSQDGAPEVGYDSWLLRVDGYDCDATGHDPHYDGGVDPIFDREPSSLYRSVTGTTVGRGRIIPLTGVDNDVMDNEEREGSSPRCKS